MKLKEIQQNLKAPKGRTNTFGKYKYRSCEDILEAVKPLLGDCTLTLSDELVVVGERYYVKATATLIVGEEVYQTTAFARESEEKKGMDDSQITGTASSYARKYALNGLFLIDDNKDADTDEFQNQLKNAVNPFEDEEKEPITKVMAKRINDIIALDKTPEQAGKLAAELYKEFQIKKVTDLTNAQYPLVVKWLEGRK